MTGVGGRPEVVIVGSNDLKNWQEYEFLYKPGDVNRRPPVVGKGSSHSYVHVCISTIAIPAQNPESLRKEIT